MFCSTYYLVLWILEPDIRASLLHYLSVCSSFIFITSILLDALTGMKLQNKSKTQKPKKNLQFSSSHFTFSYIDAVLPDILIQINERASLFSGDEFRSGKVKVTVGGDQLTRVNLDSAQHLRSGSHEPLERFDHLSPIVEEYFHIQQDLLEVRDTSDVL
jgi:hypothetical protein